MDLSGPAYTEGEVKALVAPLLGLDAGELLEADVVIVAHIDTPDGGCMVREASACCEHGAIRCLAHALVHLAEDMKRDAS